MKLILGEGYYPYAQKPVDYQPYRPIYLYRGPPPDAGFSYGLYEDAEEQKLYYSELGLEPFSPFSGKPAKLLKELEHHELEREMEKLKEGMSETECKSCGSRYVQNFGAHLKGREQYFCHKCGGKLVVKLKEPEL